MTLEPCASAPILTPMSPPRRILSIWLARLSVDRWRRAHAPEAQAAADAAPTALILETAHGPRGGTRRRRLAEQRRQPPFQPLHLSPGLVSLQAQLKQRAVTLRVTTRTPTIS